MLSLAPYASAPAPYRGSRLGPRSVNVKFTLGASAGALSWAMTEYVPSAGERDKRRISPVQYDASAVAFPVAFPQSSPLQVTGSAGRVRVGNAAAAAAGDGVAGTAHGVPATVR